MHLAISTGSLSRNTLEALDRAAGLGFGHVDVKLQAEEFDYGYRRKPNVRFYRSLKSHLESRELSVWVVSPPSLTQEQMFSARARKEILMGGAGAAGILGGQTYVAHPADLFTSEAAFQHYVQAHDAPPVIDGYDEAWAQVVNRHMTLALTNRDYWLGVPLTNQADVLGRIIQDLAIGCALDVPQALRRNTLEEWLRHVGERLAVVYAYDLDEEGQVVAPISDEWQARLALLKQTRLKCLVLRAGQHQSDQEIMASRSQIEAWLS